MKYHVKKLHRGDGKDTFQKNKRTQIWSFLMHFNNAIVRHSWSMGQCANWEGSTLLALKNTL